jgi:molybdopterin-guanine dinucleotide biosynthesis protein A
MGEDKACVLAAGEPLVLRVIGRLAGACEEVLVVAAPAQVLPPLPPWARVVRDSVAFEGPLAGLAAALEALGEGSPPRVFVTGVDAVQVSAELVSALAVWGGPLDAVAVGAPGERPAPLPVLLPLGPARAAARDLLAAGERSLRALVMALAPVVVRPAELLARCPALAASDPDLRGLEDADDPAALQVLLGP